MKKEYQHADVLGNHIMENDVVVFASGNILRIGLVEKSTEKMVRVNILATDKKIKSTRYIYPKDSCVIASGPDATFLLLKMK